MPKRCNCADHDKHPGDGFATSEGCPAHDPWSEGECPSCGGVLYDGGGFDLACDACGSEWNPRTIERIEAS